MLVKGHLLQSKRTSPLQAIHERSKLVKEKKRTRRKAKIAKEEKKENTLLAHIARREITLKISVGSDPKFSVELASNLAMLRRYARTKMTSHKVKQPKFLKINQISKKSSCLWSQTALKMKECRLGSLIVPAQIT